MNRAALVESALESALGQTFQDFEIIISDNSTTETEVARTKSAVERHRVPTKARYIRPSSFMNMPDHWEWATSHAAGEYVTVLTDRFVMRPSALLYLRMQIAALHDDIELCAWDAYSHFDHNGILHLRNYTGAMRLFESSECLRAFAQLAAHNSRPLWVNELPRTISNCYRRDLASRIRAKHGRLFFPLNPDYTSAFLALSYSSRFAYFDCPLVTSHGSQTNGTNAFIWGMAKYCSTLHVSDWQTATPIPIETVTNAIVFDLISTLAMVGDSVADIDIDLVGYYLNQFLEVLIMERRGVQRSTSSLLNTLWEGVATLDPQQRAKITQGFQAMCSARSKHVRARRALVWSGLAAPVRAVAAKCRYFQHRFANKPTYSGALDAVRKTDSLLALDGQPHE